jgi:hypothetical protein
MEVGNQVHTPADFILTEIRYRKKNCQESDSPRSAEEKIWLSNTGNKTPTPRSAANLIHFIKKLYALKGKIKYNTPETSVPRYNSSETVSS